MKRILLPLLALLACAGLSQATGYHVRSQFVVAPVFAPVYVQPLALATCGASYTAPAVQQLVVPQIAPIVGTASVTQSYAVQGASQVVTQQYAAPAVVQQVVTPNYSYNSLAIVGNAYSHVQAVRVLNVRQRLAVVNHGVQQVRVQNVKAVRQAVVVESSGRQRISVNAPGVRVRVR
jgi:hypothetical protein